MPIASGAEKQASMVKTAGEAGAAAVPMTGKLSRHPAHCLATLHLTLPASLSGTFLQTLPDLVTPLKGMQRRGQRPPKGSGTNMTVEAT